MFVVRDAEGVSAFAGCVLVPTMGALHAGHTALVREAARVASAGGTAGRRRVVVSVFVNPTQFGPNEDYARYPRTLEADLAACEAAGADGVFAPGVEVVYPPPPAPPVRIPALPRVATEPGLEDAVRPGHFAGVCQVVGRLFELVRPSAAVFGEKDWQQLQVVRAMTAAEGLGVEIVGFPTVREADGLAMSSRNRFLSAEDRRRGLALSQALCECQAGADPDGAEAAMRRVLAAEGIRPDYAVVREAETLVRRPGEGGWERGVPMRALIAARVGGVRLLDNAGWGSDGVTE